jgi:hypothetical protein
VPPPRCVLLQTEQFEVIDDERADQHKSPAHKCQDLNRHGERRIADVPHDCRDWPPLPKQQDQHQAREQHIGAAFNGPGDVLRPPPFEWLSRHHAVLNREQRHQQNVDDQCFAERDHWPAVDVLRYPQPGYEADGVEERSQKNDIRYQPVQECDDPSHGRHPSIENAMPPPPRVDRSKRRWFPKCSPADGIGAVAKNERDLGTSR